MPKTFGNNIYQANLVEKYQRNQILNKEIGIYRMVRSKNERTNERTTQDELILKGRKKQSPSILLFHFISYKENNNNNNNKIRDQTRLEWTVDYVDYDEGERAITKKEKKTNNW